MIRKAEAQDAMAIAAFLERHIETSMFLLGNLNQHGIGNTEHPHVTQYFLRETGDGITGVFGCTNDGFLMCQLPGLSGPEAQTYAHLLRGYTLRGMTGVPDQVAQILAALPVPPEAWQVNRMEPLFALELAGLVAQAGTIRAPEADDLPLLTGWFADYMTDTGTHDAESALAAAPDRARADIAAGNTRLFLDEQGMPVAMTAINARAGAAVQIGGVFVPRDRRGTGLAGRAVAAHLVAQRAQGITRAILFAASEAAARAYTRIGFERIGSYQLATLKQPVTLDTPT